MTPQAFPLFATIKGVEYLVVGWTDYAAPRLIRLDTPTVAQAKVPTKLNVEDVTFALNQWTPPPIQTAPIPEENFEEVRERAKSFYPAGQHGPRHHATPTDYPQGRQI